MKAYEVIYYHDEPEDAATDSKAIWPVPTLAAAKALAKRPPSDRWNGGATIHRGEYEPAVLGVRPENFETDEDYLPWYVFDGEVSRG